MRDRSRGGPLVFCCLFLGKGGSYVCMCLSIFLFAYLFIYVYVCISLMGYKKNGPQSQYGSLSKSTTPLEPAILVQTILESTQQSIQITKALDQITLHIQASKTHKPKPPPHLQNPNTSLSPGLENSQVPLNPNCPKRPKPP